MLVLANGSVIILEQKLRYNTCISDNPESKSKNQKKQRQVQFLLCKISCVLFYVLFNGIEILFLLHLHSTILIIILHPFVVIGGVWTDSIQVRVTGHLGGDAEREAIFNIIVGNRNQGQRKKGRNLLFKNLLTKKVMVIPIV